MVKPEKDAAELYDWEDAVLEEDTAGPILLDIQLLGCVGIFTC